MEKQQKFSIWYVLLGIWIVLLLQQSVFSLFAVKVIPYSQFLEALKANNVKEVAISAKRIQGKMKAEDGKEMNFRTIRVDAALLMEKEKIDARDIQSLLAAEPKPESTVGQDDS